MKTEDFSNIQRSVTKSVTVTFLFRLEGLKLNDTDWINDFKEKRTQYGVSQNRLAVMAGISREYVSRIESGKVALTEEIKGKFTDALEKLNPENPLEMVLDYVRIRFPTQDVRHVVEDILQLKLDVMIHEDYGFYSYAEHYVLGDVFVLTSPDKEKGTLLELKGKGCRQMESYLLAQHRSWYDFLMDALVEGGVMKRLDLLFLFIVTSDDEESGSSSLDFSGLNLSAEVLKHQSTVEKYAKEYRISDYVNYLLAIMQVESGGTGTTDVMQASESLGLPLNSLSVEDSIKQGCKYFSELLKSAEAKDCDINTVVQSYNYGGGFIDYVSKHGKKFHSLT